jgi:signal transduction histidine kinase/purine-cytosine permease-like protein/DNA-binding NarL/FixJ family response regulator
MKGASSTRQRISRGRREYNQWVANQTLEDYALRFTAKSARRFSTARVANTALGAVSFLALEAIGGTITIGYGFTNAVAAILAVGLLIFAAGLPISYYAARYGVDIDLLTRGAGFGYIGSTITSLIYASFTFIFFAIEAVILASMLEAVLGVPQWLGYILCSVVVVPLVTHGITFISRFQLWTQPLWIGLHLLPFICIAAHNADALHGWTRFPGLHGDGTFNLALFGVAGSVVLSLIAQIGEQVDFLRFLPAEPGPRRSRQWWCAVLAGGAGWIGPGILKLLAGSFLATLAIAHGLPPTDAAKPTWMYRVAFGYVSDNPAIALGFAAVFVAISQIKINVTNAYAGSIAWSNFFSRLTHSHPGRVVWLVFNIAIALMLMEIGVYEAIEHILVIYSIIAAAWVGALVADLVVNKPIGLSPAYIEFKRAHLCDINPVGVGAMMLAVAFGLLADVGGLGPIVRSFTPFVALVVAFVSAPLIALATGGRTYLARKPRAHWAEAGPRQCVICENAFEPEDMAHCPAYAGPICSLCCSLDARCHDSCKPASTRAPVQLSTAFGAIMPRPVHGAFASPLGHYFVVLGLLAIAIGAILLGLYDQAATRAPEMGSVIAASFWKAYVVLLLIAGVAAWLLVLALQSRRVAEEETRRQTALLLTEIGAHRRTDAQLQRAKEAAEAANMAKSRFVVGVSHELRSPLNAILGYAQLLESDPSIPAARRDSLRIIRRSAEHLAGLIEGLLDISKIEAGRIELYRDEVQLAEFLDQLVNMFRLQAQAKGIDFHFVRPASLPQTVHTDERRLRQILINLLSNAIKFTATGGVTFRVRWRNEIAVLEIADTGIGIGDADLARIFEPFQRADDPEAQKAAGIGLGLTITKLLTQIMGGEVTVTSRPGEGSRFRVKLMLPRAAQPSPAPVEHHVIGYAGRRLTVMVVDDNALHRQLVEDVLSPLGCTILAAPDGAACLELAAQSRPDLFLLDLAMPGMTGWELARRLREAGHRDTAIIILSANVNELRDGAATHPGHDGVLIKPLNIPELLAIMQRTLGIEWHLADPLAHSPALAPPGPPPPRLTPEQMEELRRLGTIGYVRGIRERLDELERGVPEARAQIAYLRGFIAEYRVNDFMAALDVAAAAAS